MMYLVFTLAIAISTLFACGSNSQVSSDTKAQHVGESASGFSIVWTIPQAIVENGNTCVIAHLQRYVGNSPVSHTWGCIGPGGSIATELGSENIVVAQSDVSGLNAVVSELDLTLVASSYPIPSTAVDMSIYNMTFFNNFFTVNTSIPTAKTNSVPSQIYSILDYAKTAGLLQGSGF